MGVLENARSDSAARGSPESRLDSWKEIATYLGRGVRTVQRWEREEGLPVHRLAHEKRGSVYAYKPEVDAWWDSRRLDLSAEPPEDAVKPATPTLDRLTWTSAAMFWPALSSDGRLLAYISDGGRDGTSPQIWLQQIGGTARCLTNETLERSHLAFAAGDTRLVFSARDATGHHVYSMPTLGGEARILKRSATAGRPSPDGKWLAYLSLDQPAGVRIAPLDGVGDERTIAPGLIDVAYVIWSPDSKFVLVRAHPDQTVEPDYWVVSIDGSMVANTGLGQRLAMRGFWPVTFPPAWVGDSLVFSPITPLGVSLWRQRLASGTFEPKGDPEQLTRGTEFDCFPTAAGAQLAFVNVHPDHNLWSVTIDPSTGVAHGPVHRLTRGPGIVMHLSLSRAGTLLSYFRARPGTVELMLRNLETGSEVAFTPEPGPDYGFPAISPSGATLAFSARIPSPRATRPLFLGNVADGTMRTLADDCGGRPKQWLDEQFLVIERFGSRRNSVALLDTRSGAQFDLLSSAEHAIMNPRVSPDGGWIAFDAACPGGPPSAYIARLRAHEAIPREAWIVVERSVSHPFWSFDGSLLYYLPTFPGTEFRNVVRARPFDASARSLGDEFTAFASTEMVVPAAISGTAPLAARDQIILVLGDFRGDVWSLRMD